MLVNLSKSTKVFYTSVFTKYLLYIIFSYLTLGVSVEVFHHIFGTQKLNIFDGFNTPLLAIKANFHNNFFFIIEWFLFSYIFILCFCRPLLLLIDKVKSEKTKSLTIAVVALALGFLGMNVISPIYKETKLFYLNITSQVAVGSCFYLIGYLLREHIWKWLNSVAGFIIFLVLVYLMQSHQTGPLYISWSTYKYGFVMHTLSALSGIYIIMLFSLMLAKMGDYRIMKKIGRNSKSIMTFHLLTFTLMDIFMSFVSSYSINPNQIKEHITQTWAFPVNLIFAIFVSMWIGNMFKKLSRGVYS